MRLFIYMNIESEINVGNRGGDYKGVRHGDNRLVCFVGAFAYV